MTGEAGIGKSTVAENFLSGLSGHVALISGGRCSERLAGTEAYLPLLEALESLLRGADGKITSELMMRTAPSWYRQLGPQYESALGGESEAASSQERLKREIALFLENLTRDQPLVLFLEDLHWADVSTVDVLTYIADRFDRTKILVIVTYRPEDMRLSEHAFLQVRPTLEQRGMLTEIPLQFLGVEHVEKYLDLEFPRHSFPGEFARAIQGRTEGSPLFVVALLSTLKDQGTIVQEGASWALSRTVDDVAGEFPSSLASAIEAKIARLDKSDRELLGLAAVQGYRFDSAVVAHALDLDAEDVEESLKPLDRDHSLVTRLEDEALPDGTLTARYEFVHVLYQHGLLDAIGAARKVTWNRRVAEGVVQHYREDHSGVASELARLFEAAREFERAADHYHVAARQALRLSASVEAVALSRSGLNTLESVTEGPDRNAKEFALLITLGTGLTLTLGWGAPEILATYRRARDLADETRKVSELHPLLIQGLFYHWTQRDVPELHELHKDQLAIANATDDPAVLVHVPFSAGGIEFWRGNLDGARRLYEKAMATYEPGQDGARFLYGHDPHVATSSYLSWTLCLAGYPDQARSLADKCLADAQVLHHPFTTGYGLLGTTWVSILCRDVSTALTLTNQGMALADEQEFPFHRAYQGMQRAWALAQQGEVDRGLREMSEQFCMYQEAGAVLATTFFLALQAEMHLLAGDPSSGLSAIERAIKMETENEEWTFDPELHRLRGELLRLGGSDPTEVESCYRSALEISRRQGARWFELRAGVSLGRLLSEQGRREEARASLERIYDWFSEGFDTPDLRAAQALLEELPV